MKKILFLTLLLTFENCFACLNGEMLKDGTMVMYENHTSIPFGHTLATDKELKEAVKRLDSLYKVTKDIDYLSDKGLALILLKEYETAIELYLYIEKIKPNRYATASNIGTTYELVGENEKAMKWLKKAVQIDPSAHMSSEWIHIKILEAKIKGKSFYTTDFLLNTNFGNEVSPKSNLTNTELTKLSQSIFHQLDERISFIKPKDEIVAQLLFDLGNVEFLLSNYDVAYNDYLQAEKVWIFQLPFGK